MEHERVLDDVCAWASEEENVRLAVLTGSAARGADALTPLSDLDVELYVRDPAPLLDGRDWYRRFGRVLVVEELENPGWHPTRLVHYVDGKIDFMVAPKSAAAGGVAYARPYRVLVDKDGLAGRLTAGPEPATSPPRAAEFEACIDDFFAAALMCAKCVARDEPWMAKVRDWDLKQELLRMLAWDHRARHGWSYDTWHAGGHLREWMDPDLADAVSACWAGFPVAEAGRALAASVSLFSMLGRRTAAALGLEPFDDAPVRREVDRILAPAG